MKKKNEMKIGINTYGLGKELLENKEDTLYQMKEAGIFAIEPGIIYLNQTTNSEYAMWAKRNGFLLDNEAVEAIQRYRANGFVIEGAHLGILGLSEENMKEAIENAILLAKQCGLKYYVIGFMTSTIEETVKYVPILKYASEELLKNGMDLLYHNHDMELEGDMGNTVIDFLLSEIPSLKVELDVGWVLFAGKDPVEIMKLFHDRIRIIHMKDIIKNACQENKEHCFTAIGEGALPLPEIIAEAKKNLMLYEIGLVIDQDRSENNITEDIKKSVIAMHNYLE